MDDLKDWLLGIAGTILVALVGLVWRMQRSEMHSLKNQLQTMQSQIDGKASTEELNRQRANITALFDHQRQDNEKFIEMMREDKREILAAVQAVGDRVDDARRYFTEELGKRPTREELRDRGVLFQAGKGDS